MATSITAFGFRRGISSFFYGSWGSAINGEDYTLLARSAPAVSQARMPARSLPTMKNINEGKGVFAPLVVITCGILGRKQFNQLSGKAMDLHSQVITGFCVSYRGQIKSRNRNGSG